MPKKAAPLPVYLELGTKRVFAGALDWPGWCVSARDEAAALQALLDSGPRYAALLKGTHLGFKAPKATTGLKVVARLKGNATTDFGAPDMPPPADSKPVDAAALRRFEKIVRACWAGLAAAAQTAKGRALRKGPRGGGRELTGILSHVVESQASYLSSLGWKFQRARQSDPAAALAEAETAVLAGLAAAARGEIPAVGPRGGQRWSARYFVRRSVWHVVDHLWEIENRLEAE